ncbi:MAG: PorT family protein [Bacteroidales bacterium]|nr:PorT family protein [Bacteroidales bacterium]
MKRLLLLIIVAFSFATSVYGQNFYGGLIAGGTMSQIGGDDRGGYHKVGIVGGAFAGLNLTEYFDVQMELKYIQKGSLSNDIENRPGSDPFLIKLDYIDLPIVFSYNLKNININEFNLKPLNLEFGLSFDFLVNARQEMLGLEVTASDPWRKVVLNTVLGVRFDINDDFAIGLRTINAMTSICKSSKYQYSNGVVRYTRRLLPYYGMFNDVVQLAVFWKI